MYILKASVDLLCRCLFGVDSETYIILMDIIFAVFCDISTANFGI